MGKKKRQEKLKKKALKEWEARRPKTFRQFLPYLPGIFLRTPLVMTAAVTVIVVLGALGLPWAAHFWFQFAVYLAFYLVSSGSSWGLWPRPRSDPTPTRACARVGRFPGGRGT